MAVADMKNIKPMTVLDAEIGVGKKDRSAEVALLNKDLADLHVLYTKTHNYHWNVTGPQFYSLHKLLEEQYEALAESIDAVAERVRQLDGFAVGTMAEYLELARLKEEAPGNFPSASDMVANLVNDHEAVIRQLRKDIDETANQHDDATTSDFLTGLAEAHEKMAWMLRAFLES
jgi:starvation-inducible DNA-binding protein